MSYEEALEWLNGKRSMTNMVTCDPLETWQERIAAAEKHGGQLCLIKLGQATIAAMRKQPE